MLSSFLSESRDSASSQQPSARKHPAFARVIVDIPAHTINKPFDYRISPGLDVEVGMTVLVPFGGRMAIAYVIALEEAASVEKTTNGNVEAGEVAEETIDEAVRGNGSISSGAACVAQAEKIRHVTKPTNQASNFKEKSAHYQLKEIVQVLSASAFDATAAKLALWMADAYVCSPALAIRAFLAPGQKIALTKSQDAGAWELVCNQAKPADDRWVSLTEAGFSYTPAKRATKQREVLEALREGSQRLAELAATIEGARSAVSALEKRGAVLVTHRRRMRTADNVTSLSSAKAPRPKMLTEGQRAALVAIADATVAAKGDVVLLDGVTGSGKTEVYLQAIERVLAAGKSALVLVPEISLTAQTLGRFRARFQDKVALLHSRLSIGERFDQWDLARTGAARVMIGPRSALFSPMQNLGLVIIDEEHETSYKQESAPRYHARDFALKLVKERGAALVLGSATPSLESLYRCQLKHFQGVSWTHITMPERPGKAKLPRVRVVDMAEQFRDHERSIFSPPLKQALIQTLKRKEKAVLLLNRRGFSNFLMCRSCGCVPTCDHCSTALTYHERTHELICHSCGRRWSMMAYPNPASECPNCKSRYIAQFGAGTQRVEDELLSLLDGAFDENERQEIAVIRMDADTTSTKGAHQRLLEEFDATDRAVLLGTQMIAKGLDFPEVTLVGVINADTVLKLPDPRAAEKSYDLLEQVAGRAGRGDLPGEVIIQTYWAAHPSIQAVLKRDRTLFLTHELAERKEACYPPYTRLTNLVLWGKHEQAVRGASMRLAESLQQALELEATQAVGTCVSATQTMGHADVKPQLQAELLGPVSCVRAKIKDCYRFHILLKTALLFDIAALLRKVLDAYKLEHGIKLSVDIDAYDVM